LTLLSGAGKFSRLHSAVNCLRQNVMRRSLALLVVVLAAGCGGGGGGTDRRTLVDSRDNYDPRSLDPALSTDVPTGRAVAYLFDGLTRFTPDAKVVPALATSWEASPDGMTYTFHLRRGVSFTDGTPFVASQVLASWQRVLDPRCVAGAAGPSTPSSAPRSTPTARRPPFRASRLRTTPRWSSS
jgi:ABC-type transport system substrate-binding protein